MNLIANNILTVVFIIGLAIIYFPQYYKIYKIQSSYGFSSWFIFLGYIGSFLAWINAIIYYVNNYKDCSGFIGCFQNLSGIILIIYQWFLFLIMYIMYIYYYDISNNIVVDNLLNSTNEFDTDSVERNQTYTSKLINLLKHKDKSSSIFYFILSQVASILCLTITLGFISINNWSGQNLEITQSWSKFLTIFTTITFCIHYLPQIYETIKLKKVGSLSLITLGIMCPGTFLWTYYLATQGDSGMKMMGGVQSNSPIVWVPFICVGLLQLLLLIIGIYYEHKRKRLFKHLVEIEKTFSIVEDDDCEIIDLDKRQSYI